MVEHVSVERRVVGDEAACHVRHLDGAVLQHRHLGVHELVVEAAVHQSLQRLAEHGPHLGEDVVTVRQRDVTVRRHDVTVRRRDVTVRRRDVTVRRRDVTVRRHDVTVRRR